MEGSKCQSNKKKMCTVETNVIIHDKMTGICWIRNYKKNKVFSWETSDVRFTTAV